MLAGFTRKKASTRRVNRKIADSTRNQRVFFSRYLAAIYGLVEEVVASDLLAAVLSGVHIIDNDINSKF